MMHDFKKTFKLFSYSYNYKTYLIFGSIFVLGGISLVICTGTGVVWGRYGGLLAMVGGFFPVQMIYSLAVSEEVMASPLRKTLLTKAAVLMNWIMFAGIFLLISLIRGIQGMGNPSLLLVASGEILMMAVFGAVLMLYGVMALKYFWLPTIIFCFFYPMMSSFFGIDGVSLGTITVTYSQVVVAGFMILTVGAALGYGLSLLIYKKPVSKMSQNASLRQYM